MSTDVSVESAASLDFEPWNRNGALITRDYLIDEARRGRFDAVLVAQELMFDDKADMIERLAGMNQEAVMALCDGLSDASDWFRALSQVAKSASARMMVAMSAIALENDEQVAA